MRVQLIGFVGPHGSGKDFACNYLVKQHGWTKLAFAGGLYDEVRERLSQTLLEIAELLSPRLQDETPETIVTSLLHWKPPVVRALLREYGTEVRRRDDSEYWTTRWLAAAREVAGPICVPDLRFLNEWQAMQRLSRHMRVVALVRRGTSWDLRHDSERGAFQLAQIAATAVLANTDADHLHGAIDALLAEPPRILR